MHGGPSAKRLYGGVGAVIGGWRVLVVCWLDWPADPGAASSAISRSKPPLVRLK